MTTGRGSAITRRNEANRIYLRRRASFCLCSFASIQRLCSAGGRPRTCGGRERQPATPPKTLPGQDSDSLRICACANQINRCSTNCASPERRNLHPSPANYLRPLISLDSPLRSKMPQYTTRDGGEASQFRRTRQSMADLKLRRLTELKNRLREDLERERIPVSTASKR